jgi:hypothetical protein
MPRKFSDGEIVKVWYSTRINTIRFIGKIIGHDKKHYEVLYLFSRALGDVDSSSRWIPRFPCDMVFSCHVHEIDWVTFSDDPSSSHSLCKRTIKSLCHGDFTQYCKSMINNSTRDTVNRTLANPASTAYKRVLYSSFSTKRVLDWALNRVFPVVSYPSRTEYLYV